MADDRVPIFELHILPMFRWIDREHMARRGLDLTNYDVVKAKADIIHRMLTNDDLPMPTRVSGGPWPKEWIALFERWMVDFRRLSLATGVNYQLSKSGGNYRLSCDVVLPDEDARCWLELREQSMAKLVFQLVLEPTVGAPPTPFPLQVRETIIGPLSLTAVHVVDQAGEHAVAVPTA